MSVKIPDTKITVDIDKAAGYPHNISYLPVAEKNFSNDSVYISSETYENNDFIRFQFCSENDSVYGNKTVENKMTALQKNASEFFASTEYKVASFFVPFLGVVQPTVHYAIQQYYDMQNCAPYAVYYSINNDNILVTEASGWGSKDVPAELTGKTFTDMVDNRLKINLASALSFYGWENVVDGKDETGKEIFTLAAKISGKNNVFAASNAGKASFSVITADIDDNSSKAYMPSLGCVSKLAQETANDNVILLETHVGTKCIQTSSELSNLLGSNSEIKKDTSDKKFSEWSVCMDKEENDYNVFAVNGSGYSASYSDHNVIQESGRAFQIVMGAFECLAFNNWESSGKADYKEINNLMDVIADDKNIVSKGNKILPPNMDLSNSEGVSDDLYAPERVRKYWGGFVKFHRP